ncbi:MAG: hypothetical protein AAGA48_19135 [Myxococcota bacterium]
MPSAHHLSLSLSRELWNELLGAALPVRIAGQPIDLTRQVREVVGRLRVRERVRGLIQDQRSPEVLRRVRELWHARRDELFDRIDEVVRIEGEWQIELDAFGTELAYGQQKVKADAYVRAVLEGSIHLIGDNVAVPFRLERRLGASVALGNIHYDPSHQAVVGRLQDFTLDLSEDNALLQVLARGMGLLLDQQLPRTQPVTILRRGQVEEMVGPMGGSLQMRLGVDDLDLVVDEGQMTLKVRFGFVRDGESSTELEPRQ